MPALLRDWTFSREDARSLTITALSVASNIQQVWVNTGLFLNERHGVSNLMVAALKGWKEWPIIPHPVESQQQKHRKWTSVTLVF